MASSDYRYTSLKIQSVAVTGSATGGHASSNSSSELSIDSSSISQPILTRPYSSYTNPSSRDNHNDPDSSASVLLQTIGPGHSTRRWCIAGLTLVYIGGVGAIVAGAIVQRITDADGSKGTKPYEPSMVHRRATGPFLQLAISFVVTALSDIAGLIHSTSLRFSLLRANKLTFNSNIRLFTSLDRRKAPVHWWPINLAWAWALISCYACASTVLLQTVYSFGSVDSVSYDVVSGYALIFLGLGLLGQGSIATWALLTTPIPTWSTNPIITAAICLSAGWTPSTPRHSMLGVHDANNNSLRQSPVYPKPKQSNAFRADKRIRSVVLISWLVTLAGFLFFAAISIAFQLLDGRGPAWQSFARSYSNDWSLIPDWRDTTAFLAVPTSLGGAYFTFGPWFLTKYLFTIALVGAITLNLHVVELLVQCSRDEALWRRAGSTFSAKKAPGGMRLSQTNGGALRIAFTSWHTIGLFVFKTALHWLFSLAFGLKWEGVQLNIPQFCYVAVLLLLLASLATGLALYKPQGPQPATFGHLQTLLDLVDVWPCTVQATSDETEEEDRLGGGDGEGSIRKVTTAQEDVRLFWGDKGKGEDGFRRAGTALRPLQPVLMDEEYM